MVKSFNFSRNKKSDERVSKHAPKERQERAGAKEHKHIRNKFKSSADVLKNMDVTLLTKMDELKALPASHAHDDIGSFFYDELETSNANEQSLEFRQLYHQIVEVSQTLPIILLNKGKILDSLLPLFGNKFFLPIVTRLLIALIRDCGTEILPEFISRVIPSISSSIKATEADLIQAAFKIIASSLRYMIKGVITQSEEFIECLKSGFLRFENVHLRRFTAEAILYILNRVRDSKVAEKILKGVIEVGELEDFHANLLALVLRGERGSISYLGQELIGYIGQLIGMEEVPEDWIRKVFNVLIESEYKFFRERKADETEDRDAIYLEDYLNKIYNNTSKSQVAKKNILLILTEILLFGSGQRFSDALSQLSLKIVQSSFRRDDPQLTLQVLTFAAKHIVVKKETPSYLSDFSNLHPTQEQLEVFLQNLFRRSTFKRIEIFKKFKSFDISQFQEPVRVPSLQAQTFQSLIPFLINSIGTALTESEGYQGLFLLAVLLVKNLAAGSLLNIPADCYSKLKKKVNDSCSTVEERLGAIKIVEYCQSWAQGKNETVSKGFKNWGQVKEREEFEVNRAYNEDYVRKFARAPVNYTVSNESDIEIMLRCEIAKLELRTRNISLEVLQGWETELVSMLGIQENHTSIIQAFLQFRTASVFLSKKLQKPASRFVKKIDEKQFKFEIEDPIIKQRVLEYLWSDIPDARTSALKLLLDQSSTLLPVLLELDTDDISLVNERPLYLTADRLTTSVHYQEFSSEEELVLFHFLQGYISFRISTLQPVLSACHAILLRRHPALMQYFIQQLAVYNLDLVQVSTDSDSELVKWLLRPFEDYVDSKMKTLRLFDWIEMTLKYAGQPWETMLPGKGSRVGKGGKKNNQDEKEAVDNKDEEVYKESNKSSAEESKKKLEVVYSMLNQLLKIELMPGSIPSLTRCFGSEEIEGGARNLEKIISQASREVIWDEEKSSKLKKRASGLEKMKRLLKSLSASPYLSKLAQKQSLYSCLLEVLKYPNEEVQVIALTTLMRLEKQNKILRQNSQMLVNLTGKDSFKDHLMKLTIKADSMTEMKKDHLMPVLNSILYRRLLDKTGLKNKSSFDAQRAFIFDIASRFRESDISDLIDSLYLTHGIEIRSSGEARPFGGKTVSISKLVSWAELCQRLIEKVGNRGGRLEELLRALGECVEVATNAQIYLRTVVPEELLKKSNKQDTNQIEEEVDEGVEENKEIPNEEGEEEYDSQNQEEEKREDEEEEVTQGVTPAQKAGVSLYRKFKQLKQVCLKRVIQIQSSYLDIDYTQFYHGFIPHLASTISNLATKPISKAPSVFALLGLWCECEVYKHYFFEHPACFNALIDILSNPNASAKVYSDTMEALMKLADFGLSEENIDEFSVKKYCKKYTFQTEEFVERKSALDGEIRRYSSIGEFLIKSSIDRIVDAVAGLLEDLDGKKLNLIRNSDKRNMNKRLSEFGLFLSDYCVEGNASIKFYDVTKKTWSVEAINRKTAKPVYKVDSAQELQIIQKEVASATNMLKILRSFAGKINKTEEIFSDFLLPLVCRMEDLKLRLILEGIGNSLVSNPSFPILRVNPQLLTKLSALHRLHPGLLRPTLDFNRIVEFLISATSKWSTYTQNEKHLLAAHSVYWLSTEELSAREKSLDLLILYISEVEYSNEIYMRHYRSIILDTIVYFLQSNFSREHVMRYYTSLMRLHVKQANSNPEVEYSDLFPLLSEEPDKDFFELIFNVKIGVRGQATKALKKIIKKGTKFSSDSIKNVLVKMFDYYVYEYWKEVTNPKSGFSHERIEQVRQMLLGVFEAYGQLIGMLPFSQFIRFIKDKIFQLGGKAEKVMETSIKIVCSCLNNLPTNLPDVLEKIKKEQEDLNSQSIQGSLVNQFLTLFKKPGDMENELEQPQEIELTNEEDEEIEEKMIVSDSQFKILKVHILFPLKRHLLKNAEGESSKFSVRPEVALGIIQIIRLFPPNMFHPELINIISKVCSVLSDRDEDRRKTARTTLISMLKILGPFFFGFMVKELAFHLKRGYQMHIRNYTIFKLLETMIQPAPGQGKQIKCGQIDYTVPLLTPLLLDEVCGDLDEEKEVQEIKNKSIEFRKNKGVEGFKLVAQKLDFKSDALANIVELMRGEFSKTNQLNKLLNKLTDLINYIISGLMANPTLTSESIIVFVKSMSDRAAENLKNGKEGVEDIDYMPTMDLEKIDTRAEKYRENFKVQEGAGQGSSICKCGFTSQNQGRKEGRKK